MIKEFYELSQTKNEEIFSVSLKTESQARMKLNITIGSEQDNIILTNEQITVLLKVCKMVKQNQININ